MKIKILFLMYSLSIAHRYNRVNIVAETVYAFTMQREIWISFYLLWNKLLLNYYVIGILETFTKFHHGL